MYGSILRWLYEFKFDFVVVGHFDVRIVFFTKNSPRYNRSDAKRVVRTPSYGTKLGSRRTFH